MCSGAGAYAEYAVADHGRTLLLPTDMTFEVAATLPVALQTMHDALITQAHLQPGETVLIQGASSGVGVGPPNSPVAEGFGGDRHVAKPRASRTSVRVRRHAGGRYK